MNECYYYLLLLSLFSNIQHSLSYENFEQDFFIHLPNITIQHVCENDLLYIKCSNINETIQIIRSMYGRTSQRICNNNLTYRFFDKTCANIEQSKYQTKLRCHEKSTCQILIDNDIFTDPCGLNIPKHFEIHYRCIDKKQICSKLILNCSRSNDLKCIQKIQEDFSCQCPSTFCQYNNNQIVGFIKKYCPEEKLQGFHWPKTLINKSQYLSCPSPCTGQVIRFCNFNSQWSKTNYSNCECPIKQSDQLSTHRSANSYMFECNFWLIDKILPKDNSCILSFMNWNEKSNDDSLNCLLSAFEQMTFQSCSLTKSFSIDFQNLAFEIYIPMNNESKFHLLSNIQSNQLIVDRTDIIHENFHMNLPIMVIDTKMKNSKNKSIILFEQKNYLTSIQTANVTIVFNHRSFDFRYQCRAYRSTNFSLHVDTTNMFFACQLLCSNNSHVICQCPFFNPFMHYILHIDTTRTENDLMIDNDLNGKCFEEKKFLIHENLNKIDRYLKHISSLTFAKKLFLFIDKVLDKENFFTNSNIIDRFIKQIEYLGFQLLNLSNSFTSITNHIEFFIMSKQIQFENIDQSVRILIMNKLDQNLEYQIIFFTISNININQSFNSPIVYLNFIPKIISIDNIQIIFRHLNQSNQIPLCVHLKNIQHDHAQWTTDGCRLLLTNLTHSICSCNQLSTFALFMDYQKKSNDNRLFFISKIGCIISLVCLLLTSIILIIIRFHMDMNEDLTMVRNTLHMNMLLCLIIVQILFLFGIDQTKHRFGCQIISILLDYFLLATFSWMFIDGVELLFALKHVFKIDRIRLITYSIYSYGFPLIIVFLSIVLSTKNKNISSTYCWLSRNNAFIWTFAIPFILIIFINFCFFIISIYYICKKINSTDQTNKMSFSLRNVSTISILFGLTWIIALFYLYDQTILFAYIFTIFNSFHGLLIFIFYCLLQKDVQNSLRKLDIYKKHHTLFFHHCIKRNSNGNQIHQKSIEHFTLPDNTSNSDYSSGHSFDITNQQILSKQIKNLNTTCKNNLSHQISLHNQYDRRFCLNNETSYLPSIPISLLTNRLSTFRYPLPSNEIILSYEQNEQLLQKPQIHEDDHQYYEIG
ncbi:unnamed protein product [Rotaria sp. Silwood1]|nr:unnamed protein product [Rotaria sp. Silwood1]CAF1622519.1 unnamed protein product [Rotaria sp. Silwood1]CAF3776645.1 unnamed protein product [Rotaria sp. Silwood1]CAF4770736.1 unnamed protein product [Rotaria sp. Silwood1]